MGRLLLLPVLLLRRRVEAAAAAAVALLLVVLMLLLIMRVLLVLVLLLRRRRRHQESRRLMEARLASHQPLPSSPSSPSSPAPLLRQRRGGHGRGGGGRGGLLLLRDDGGGRPCGGEERVEPWRGDRDVERVVDRVGPLMQVLLRRRRRRMRAPGHGRAGPQERGLQGRVCGDGGQGRRLPGRRLPPLELALALQQQQPLPLEPLLELAELFGRGVPARALLGRQQRVALIVLLEGGEGAGRRREGQSWGGRRGIEI